MSEGKRYFWLKLKDDFFDSKRIKKLRRTAGGDTFVIIYLKMQLKAIKSNGILEYTGLEGTFAEELALDLDERVEDVQITLNYLQATGLLETSDDINFFLPYAVENTGSENASTQRVREHRKRKALQCNADETEVKRIGNVEIEKEKESERESESYIESYKESESEEEVNQVHSSALECTPFTPEPVKDDSLTHDEDPMRAFLEKRIVDCLIRDDTDQANRFFKMAKERGIIIDPKKMKERANSENYLRERHSW